MTKPSPGTNSSKLPGSSQVDFRHLEAFRHLHAERNLTEAGAAMGTTRKGMARMILNLENALGSELFLETSRGPLVPTAFGERLHHDLKGLTGAQQRLEEQINAIRETGRILRIASSAAVFRTTAFRNLFREIQSTRGIRTSFTSIESSDPGRELVSGHCDLYIGCWSGRSTRFVNQVAGEVPFKMLVRKPNTGLKPGQKLETPRGPAYFVILDGKPAESGPPAIQGVDWRELSESQWLRWVDHPDECDEGTMVCGPEWPADQSAWDECNPNDQPLLRRRLQVSYLRQHPFEFLPSLAARIQSRRNTQ